MGWYILFIAMVLTTIHRLIQTPIGDDWFFPVIIGLMVLPVIILDELEKRKRRQNVNCNTHGQRVRKLRKPNV